MPAILCGSLDTWRPYFSAVPAVVTLASIMAMACNVAAEEPKHVRITAARSVSAIPLWGIGPFAEKAGFRVEYIPAGTNADMQRNLQSGVEVGTLGYQSPAVMAEQLDLLVESARRRLLLIRTSPKSRSLLESSWAVIILSWARRSTLNRGRTSKESASADRQEVTLLYCSRWLPKKTASICGKSI